jgi:hypothetical protein
VIDERLGRHSTTALIVLIPGAVVALVLLAGMARPGDTYPALVRDAVFAVPPLAGLALGLLNGGGLPRALVRALLAVVLMVAWYALLVLPFAAFCTLASGTSCM